jgi:hypothetical protein
LPDTADEGRAGEDRRRMTRTRVDDGIETLPAGWVYVWRGRTKMSKFGAWALTSRLANHLRGQAARNVQK